MLWAGKSCFLKRGAIAAAVALVVAVPIRAAAENLADALASAYRSSGLVDQNRALLRAADEDAAIALSTLRPVVDFVLNARRVYNDTTPGLGSTRTSPATAQVQLQWLLFDGGARRFQLEAAKETVLALRQSLLSVEQQVLFRAVNAYFNVILQSENVSLRRNNLRVLREELRAAQDRFEVGEVTRTDVALAESRVAAARAELSDSEGALVDARAEFTNAVGRAPGALAGQSRLPQAPKSIDSAVARAVKRHPDVLEAQHRVSAAELAIHAAARNIGPNVTLDASVGYTDHLDSSRSSEDASVGLALRQRLYQGGGKMAQLRKAMAQRDAARGNLLRVQRDVVQGVSDAYARLQVARASLVASAERVRAAQVAFDGIREEATLGARTTLDVLSAEQELLNARTAQISARAEESVAAYQLLQSQGILTAEDLKLAVQLYDPTAYYNLAKDAPSRLSKQSRDLDRVLKALGKQ